MPLQSRWVLPLAGLLALAGSSCATTQRPSGAEQASATDEQSKQEMRQAQEAQQRAAEQEKNVSAAREEVAKAQQQLAQAQRREGEERAKFQQLQQQASLHMSRAQATQQAGPAPAAGAPGVPAPAGQQALAGPQTISGHVLQARPNQLVIQERNGQTLTLDVNDRTQIFVGSERRSAAELQQGADARVAYDNASGRPTALTVEVPRAGAAAPAPAGAAQPVPPAPPSQAPAPEDPAAPVPGSENTPPPRAQ